MNMQFQVRVDWDDDGNFDTPHEMLDRDVIALEWALGLAAPADCLAAPSWATITLHDPAGRYRPENAAGPLHGALVPRKRVRIQRGERLHFTGWIESVTPGHDRTVTLRCAGLETLLQRAEVFPPLLLDVTADAVIAAILAGVDYPPALLGFWQLGLARLGSDTRLPDLTTYADLEPGRTLFACAGDWPGGISAWEALRDVVEAERGLLWVDGGGRVIVWNRHHLRGACTPVLTLTEREAVFTAALDGACMVNRAVITCHPREVGGAGETLWTLHRPLRLPPGEARTLRARLTDGAGLHVGALALEPPLAGADYTATERWNGSGADRTGQVSVTVQAASSSALLTFTSQHGAPLYLQPGARLRGSALRDTGPTAAEIEDRQSILHHGRRAVGLDLPLLSALEDAEGVARLLVTEGSTPRAQVQAVTVSGQVPGVLEAGPGDCLRLVDRLSGHDGLYHIVGERHTLKRGGVDHVVRWVVRPAAVLSYWQLGRVGAGEMGQATRVVY